MRKINLESKKNKYYHFSVDSWIYKDGSVRFRQRFSAGDITRDKEILINSENFKKFLEEWNNN